MLLAALFSTAASVFGPKLPFFLVGATGGSEPDPGNERSAASARWPGGKRLPSLASGYPFRAGEPSAGPYPADGMVAASVGLHDLRVGTAELERYGDLGVVSVAPEPAVLAGEGRLDRAGALGRAAAPVVVDGLAVAMSV